jgi:hypothetical protein
MRTYLWSFVAPVGENWVTLVARTKVGEFSASGWQGHPAQVALIWRSEVGCTALLFASTKRVCCTMVCVGVLCSTTIVIWRNYSSHIPSPTVAPPSPPPPTAAHVRALLLKTSSVPTAAWHCSRAHKSQQYGDPRAGAHLSGCAGHTCVLKPLRVVVGAPRHPVRRARPCRKIWGKPRGQRPYRWL